MRRETLYSVIVAGVCIGCLLHAGDVSAQAPEDNLFTGPIEQFRTRMLAAQATTAAVLNGTFWALATIEFTFAMVMVAIHDGSMETFVKELVIRILFIGFFFTLLNNGADWVNAIIRTFKELGADAGGIPINSLTPDGIIDVAADMMKRSTFSFSVFDAGSSLALIVVTTITFLALLLIAANLALVLIEFYIVAYGGIFLLALGGSRWTSDYAVAYLKYAFSIGMRLFVFYVLAGIGFSVIEDYIVNDLVIDNIFQYWSLAGFAVVLCYVSTKAPDAITNLLNGVTTQASISMVAAVRTAGSGAAAVTAGSGASAAPAVLSSAGGGSAASQAFRPGSQQPGSTSLNAAGNLAQAGYAEASTNLGSAFPGKGTVGGRMTPGMAAQRTSSASAGSSAGGSSPTTSASTPAGSTTPGTKTS